MQHCPIEQKNTMNNMKTNNGKRRYVKPELYPFAIKGELLIGVGSGPDSDGGLSKGNQNDFDDFFDDDFSTDPVLYDYSAWEDVKESDEIF